MNWKVNLRNIDELSDELNLPFDITALNYHLHQQWLVEDDYAIGGEECGQAGKWPVIRKFACGPASGVSPEICNAIGRPRLPRMAKACTCVRARTNKKCMINVKLVIYPGNMVQSRFKKQVGVTKLCRMILCQPWVRCDVELCRELYLSLSTYLLSCMILD